MNNSPNCQFATVKNISDLQELLKTATSLVDCCYFQTEIMDNNMRPKIVYRERVYCYELYHQMRKIWPHDNTLILHGEYDKSGSQFFAGSNVNGVKPDFLIHTPGTTDKNLLAMEVKAVTANLSDIKCDLLKLSRMRSEVSYFATIFLIFGKDSTRKANQIRSLQLQWVFNSNIEIWAHENPNEAATKH